MLTLRYNSTLPLHTDKRIIITESKDDFKSDLIFLSQLYTTRGMKF